MLGRGEGWSRATKGNMVKEGAMWKRVSSSSRRTVAGSVVKDYRSRLPHGTEPGSGIGTGTGARTPDRVD